MFKYITACIIVSVWSLAIKMFQEANFEYSFFFFQKKFLSRSLFTQVMWLDHRTHLNELAQWNGVCTKGSSVPFRSRSRTNNCCPSKSSALLFLFYEDLVLQNMTVFILAFLEWTGPWGEDFFLFHSASVHVIKHLSHCETLKVRKMHPVPIDSV